MCNVLIITLFLAKNLFNPSSWSPISLAANAVYWAFFLYCSQIKTLRQKEKWYTCVSFVHQFVWGHEKKAFSLHVWLSKVLLLEITLNKTKNNFKKNFFLVVTATKKKKMLGLSLPLFQKKSKNNRSPALAFVFSNKQPKSCFVYKWETFFFFAFFIYQKTKFPTDKLFFFVNKTILKWETETKQKRSWTGPSVFLLILFAFFHPRQNKKTRFYKSEETIVRKTHSLCLKFEKLF